MSLGLFALDEDDHVWFDVDCYQSPETSPPIPKHVVFNISEPDVLKRVLMLYTEYIEFPEHVIQTLLQRSGAPVCVQDIVTELQDPTSVAARLVYNTGYNGYTRIVYYDSVWRFISIDWMVQSGRIVITPNLPNTLTVGALEGIGIPSGLKDAKADWPNTVNKLFGARLRSALTAAAQNSTAIIVPGVRQPVRLDHCIQSFANANMRLD